jgi:hypothetical protein
VRTVFITAGPAAKPATCRPKSAARAPVGKATANNIDHSL